MNKKTYIIPSMRVVARSMHQLLLAGSVYVPYDATEDPAIDPSEAEAPMFDKNGLWF